MKLMFIVVCLLISVLVTGQSINRSGIYYYKSLYPDEPFRNYLIGSANQEWSVKKNELKVRKGMFRKRIELAFAVTGAAVIDTMLMTKCYIINDGFEIKKTLDIEKSENNESYLIKARLKKGEKIIFCLDGGVVYLFDPNET
jgi:hypothetical protein